MIKQKLKQKLLIVFITIGNFCFGQNFSSTYLILDSADVNNASSPDCCTYYKNQKIVSKLHYNYWPNRVHYEFVLLGKDKYYCIEYDSAGKKLQEGPAIKESKPFQTFEIPVYNNDGEVIKTKKALNFKLGKDEEWTEYDSAYLNFKRGFYKKGVKEGKWTVVKNEH